jgi:multidrug efflux pump subunit AcrB
VRVGPSCCWSRLTLFWLIRPLLVAAASLLAADWIALLAVTAWAELRLLMLMGVVTKNSILLVEYAITARRQGLERNAALIDACHKRARPIVMTTIAMTAGMLPIALGWGSDPSFRAPMAIAVIGGLMTSTLLSLLVIPAVFTYIDDLEIWLGKMRTRLQKA